MKVRLRESHTHRPLLLHCSLRNLIRLRALQTLQSTLKDLHREKSRASGPQNPGEGSEGGVCARGGAHGATAEQELAEEGCEGDEAGEVEEGV
jgi:hypothetical protein